MPISSLNFETSNYLVQGTKFEVDKKYEILDPMTHGRYGKVCSAKDTQKAESVAVKKIEGVFDQITITKRTLRELRILRHLRHENIVDVKNIFINGDKNEFEDIYVVTDLMETDLASTLKSTQELSEAHCQFFLYQLLRGMKYVHSAHVIHRDLKPRNLFVNSNCDLKICDFGLARVRFSNSEWVSPMTEYVCTRWYRAPEVLCSWTDYSGAVDMWSIGCIFAEMYARNPLFPGQNTQHQLDVVIGLLGSPDAKELMKIPNEKCRKFVQALPVVTGHSFAVAFPSMSESARALLRQLLRWDPDSRITVDEAVQSPYVEMLHCPEDEPTRSPLLQIEFEFERRKITAAALREEIFRECLYYYPDLSAQFEQELRETGSRYDIQQYRLLVSGEAQYSSDEDNDSDLDDANP